MLFESARDYCQKQKYDEICFLHTVTPLNNRQSKARYQKDLELLLREYDKNPVNPRTVFYLAQTYDCLQDLRNAYKYYFKRSQVKGWIEEDFVTVYRLGCIADHLCKADDYITWATAFDHYSKAFAIRRTRI